jgi:glutathione reductase (NADPH)
MPESFDLVVIGSGVAASSIVGRCRDAGWSVAIVDELPLGGTCVLRGCDPKKVLMGAADLVDGVRLMEGAGGLRGTPTIDWPALMAFKRGFTDPVPAERERSYAAAGITVVRGHARFTGEARLDVGGRTLEARHVVLATGAIPRPLGIPGAELVASSTDFLSLPELPRRLLFVGGGYVSFELAHIARRAGAAVTIAGRGRPLKQFEPDLVARLVEHTRALGIDVQLGPDVVAVARRDDGALAVTLRGDGGERSVVADLVVHGGGRVPNSAGLALATAHVASDETGAILVDDYLRSRTNPRVWAAGDVASMAPGKRPLTPVAGYEGGLVASNLLDGPRHARVYRAIASVVFTIPALAGVGRTEAEAARDGLDVRVSAGDTSGWYNNRRLRQPVAGYKVLIDKKSERIVGAHLLGPHVEEAMNLFVLAMRHDLPASALREMQYAYPSASSDISYMV